MNLVAEIKEIQNRPDTSSSQLKRLILADKKRQDLIEKGYMKATEQKVAMPGEGRCPCYVNQ